MSRTKDWLLGQIEAGVVSPQDDDWYPESYGENILDVTCASCSSYADEPDAPPF